MDFSLDQWLKLAANLSFTSFLILCVGVLGYALYQLYLANRTDWTQVQQNTQDINQLNQNVGALITKIDQLIGELNTTNKHSAMTSADVQLTGGSESLGNHVSSQMPTQNI